MAPETEMLLECEQIFKRLEGKIDDLIIRDEKRNCKYDKHVEESASYRETVIRHDEILKNICSLKQWWFGAILTIIISLLSLAVIWGGLLVRVSNLEKQRNGYYSGMSYTPDTVRSDKH